MNINLQHYFYQADVVLASVFWTLAGMSCITWFLFFWKLALVYAEKYQQNKIIHFWLREKAFIPDVEKTNRYTGMFTTSYFMLCEQLAAQIAHKPHIKEVSTDLFNQLLENTKQKRDTGLSILATIGSAAPFIGLLGTVWGIYGTLMAISSQQNSSVAVVSGPMGEALIATAFGLFVAIPSVMAYNSLLRLLAINHLAAKQICERLQHSCIYASVSEE